MDSIVLKICGLTKRSPIRNIVSFPEIAYIGCINYERSSRHESLHNIKDIFAEAKNSNPKIRTVLTLFNQSMGYSLDALKETGADILQFAGAEKEIFLEQIKSHSPVSIWKTIYVRDFRSVEDINVFKSADYFILDRKTEEDYLNLEQEFNFGIFNYAKTYTNNLILGGGVSLSNIRNVLRICQPNIIDVSLGVESSPGVKDLTKISSLIHVLKN